MITTGLQETLPILEREVPALPGRVEAVARKADALERSARAALASFEQKRGAAEGLAEQVRAALQAVRDLANEAGTATGDSERALRETSEQETHGLDEAVQALSPAAQLTVSAFQALESALDEGAVRLRTAYRQAGDAVDSLDEHTRTGRSELQQAAGKASRSLEDARQAISEGQASVSEAVERLSDEMAGMLERVRMRLERARARLDEMRDEQEDVVADTLADLSRRREATEQGLSARLADGLPGRLDPELDALAERWGGLGEQVAQAEAECRGGRDELEPQRDAAAALVEPLTGAVAQVKEAAERVGLEWP